MKKIFLLGFFLLSCIFLSGCDTMFTGDFESASDITGAPTGQPEKCYEVDQPNVFTYYSEKYSRILKDVQVPRGMFNVSLNRVCCIGTSSCIGESGDCSTAFRLTPGSQMPGNEIWFYPFKNWEGKSLYGSTGMNQKLILLVYKGPWSIYWFDGNGPDTVPVDVYAQQSQLNTLPDFIKNCKVEGGKMLLAESDKEKEMPNLFFESSNLTNPSGLVLKKYYVKIGERDGPPIFMRSGDHYHPVGIVNMSKDGTTTRYDAYYTEKGNRIYLQGGGEVFLYSGTDNVVQQTAISNAKTIKLELLKFAEVGAFHWYTP